MDDSVVRRHITIGRRALSYLAAGPLFEGDSMARSRGTGRPPHAGHGNGPVKLVVLLHAFPLHAGMWRPQLSALPPGWSAVAPDFRGFGESAPDDGRSPRADARLEDYADDVGALIDALGAGRAALCGCSMGGYAALAALRRLPGRVSGLLLADSRASADSDAARASRAAMIELLDREGPAGVASDMRARLVGPTSKRDRPDVLAEIDGLMGQATASGIGYAVGRMLNRPDVTADLASFCGPVCVVVGEEDTLTPPGEAASMAALVPGAAFVAIPRAGHLSNLEAPEPFNTAMHAWLGRIAARNS